MEQGGGTGREVEAQSVWLPVQGHTLGKQARMWSPPRTYPALCGCASTPRVPWSPWAGLLGNSGVELANRDRAVLETRSRGCDNVLCTLRPAIDRSLLILTYFCLAAA